MISSGVIVKIGVEWFENVKVNEVDYNVPKKAADQIRKDEVLRFVSKIKMEIEKRRDTTRQRGHVDYNAGLTAALIVVLRVLRGEK